MRELLQNVFPFNSKTGSRPNRGRRKSRGQSLVEMAIALPAILVLFSGLIEMGFMLNYYLSLLDATRNAARDYAGPSPFDEANSYVDRPGFYFDSSMATGAGWDVLNQLNPLQTTDNTRKVILNPATDDVIVTVYSVVWKTGNHTIQTFPQDGAFSGAVGGRYYLYGNALPNGSHGNQASFTQTTLESQLIEDSPCQGLVVVEVIYQYHQILNLPWMFWLGSPILHAYSVMPNQSAEPPVPVTGIPQANPRLPACQ